MPESAGTADRSPNRQVTETRHIGNYTACADCRGHTICYCLQNADTINRSSPIIRLTSAFLTNLAR